MNQIDWSKSNQVSINTSKKPQQNKGQGQQVPKADYPGNKLTNGGSRADGLEDVPVNNYRSVVAPVKSGQF